MLSKDLDLLKKLNLLDNCHSVFHDPSANEVPVVYNVQQFEIKEFSRGNSFVQALHYCSSDCRPEQPIGMLTGQYMFEGCKTDTLDLTHWDMSEVKSLSYMFCRSRIKDLCINSWQLNAVEDMSYMFLRAFVSEGSDFSSWKVNCVRNLTGAFQECKGVKEINLSGWEVDSVVSISRIFSLCQTLEKVCLTGWNLSPDCCVKEAIANSLCMEVIGSEHSANRLYRDRSASLVDIASRTAGESTGIGLSPAVSIIESYRHEVLETGMSPLGSNRKVRGTVPSRKCALKLHYLNRKYS